MTTDLRISAAGRELGEPSGHDDFRFAKTTLQTNSDYDPRLAIAVDSVIVHRHGAEETILARAIGSWSERGYAVGRMFFADSDATNEYWTGKWDGTPHPDEVERDARGEAVLCSGIRPYMLPTAGWTRYLQEMSAASVRAGAEAIFPEEPLAHVYTGYEGKFRELWVARYGRPWQPESASPEARFLTAQLKNELYLELERALGRTVREEARKAGRPVPFIFPVHGLYSNIAAHLVAPLGTSLAIEEIDGYIGQVWTGPIRWAADNYDSPDKSFFASAFALYDSFAQLVRGSKRRMWLLTDPVEDDPNHAWGEFEQWYRHCVVAELLFPQTDAFEVMPWPDRIFLPGHATGGGTPAPERFRILTLSAVQIQQEVPPMGEWRGTDGDTPTEGVGVVMADTLLWHRHEPPVLQDAYSLLMPLIQEGVPVGACLLERVHEPAYLAAFKALVLSYEAIKPLDPAMHVALAKWVRAGGSLIVLGKGDNLNEESLWWVRQGLRDPLDHLFGELGLEDEGEFDRPVGKGHVYRRITGGRRFADPEAARAEYLPLLDAAVRQAGGADGLRRPGHFCMKRGAFVVAHAIRQPLRLAGPLVDVFDPEFPVLDGVELQPGESGLYREVGELVASAAGRGQPVILHTTHRLMSDTYVDGVSRAVIRGPAETPAVVRFHAAGRELQGAEAVDPEGKDLAVERRQDGASLLVRFPNVPAGATLTIRWKGRPT
jgi:hypothetical protein